MAFPLFVGVDAIPPRKFRKGRGYGDDDCPFGLKANS